jgi:curved DNA-binding protein CbpA
MVTSIARKFYKELARRYHPDKGGTNEQMANLKLLEDQMMALVEMNEGLGK